jgi:2-amino-4-hydroxy-6-hydroxymethyldihydropteridine diphosphokinase
MNKAYILIGGNLGDRLQYLQTAKNLMEQRLGRLMNWSSVYETAAWGKEDQPTFLNQVLLIHTSLEPRALLNGLLQIEKELGRYRGEKNGPRIIDLDILFYNQWIMKIPDLELPHPRISQRRFVLVPMADIAPDFRHPVLNKSMADLLASCPDPLIVHKWE